MYHPYFRGKQFELIAIRESARLLSQNNFVPIIEPVRESLSGLKRTLSAITAEAGSAVLVINPKYGEYADDLRQISKFASAELQAQPNIGVGVLATNDEDLDEIVSLCRSNSERQITLIHAGLTDAGRLARQLSAANVTIQRHVFLEATCGKLYRRHFRGVTRVLLRDGFKRQRNRDYPFKELFSDLHATFEDEKMDGFGDFLIVGDEYIEAGGPAYAVAIHLTYIDPAKDNAMYIYHFKSDRNDTPVDPAGKFAEALAKLVGEVQVEGCPVLQTDALEEFLGLHRDGHFPGLGYVKKLSMKHHIETLADYIASNAG